MTDIVVNETENDLYSVFRYYEKINDDLLFKIRIKDKKKDSETLLSTQIYPHKLELISEIFKSLSLPVKNFGDLNLNEFEKNSSKDLVIIGEKN